MLAVLAGTSVFAHLCIYDVNPEGCRGGREAQRGGDKGGLSHVHELHPSKATGAIMTYLWLNDTVRRVRGRGRGRGRVLARS